MRVNVKRLDPAASLPVYATEGAACFDIAAMEGGTVPAVFSTGLAFEVPEGHVMLVFSRSGHGFKNDVRLANCVGVIDSDYRGELKVKLAADGAPMAVAPGDRIAQAMVLPVSQCEFVEVNELDETDRGQGGFGSTGC